MIQNQDLEPLLLRGAEVARLIGCSRALAYRLMQRGVLPTIRIPGGKSIRVPRQALMEWILDHTAASPRSAVKDRAGGKPLH